MEEAFCRLLEHSLATLCDLIEEGEKTEQEPFRTAAVRIIHNLPVINGEFYRIAQEHEHFEPLLFYERVRLGIVSLDYFLDGCPFGIQLFCGVTGMPDNSTPLPIKFKFRDAIADRLQTIGKLEVLRRDSSEKRDLVARCRHGFGESIPGPVCVFISRCREVARYSRRVKRQSCFVQCANQQCNRLFFCGATQEYWESAREIDIECEEGSSSTDYWDSACGQQMKIGDERAFEEPDCKRFCSRECATQHSQQVAEIMPDEVYLDADDSAKKIGRAKVSEAFKLALKRNEVASRKLRSIRSLCKKAVSDKEILERRERYVSQLNIDLGILYASFVISESKALSKNKLLPGIEMNWRNNPLYYAKAMASVKKIYSKMRRAEGIISNMLTMPRYMEVLQSKAHKLF